METPSRGPTSSASKPKRDFRMDFDRLLSDLSASKPSKPLSEPESGSRKPPSMRFNEAEDAGDTRYVEKWEKAAQSFLSMVGPEGAELLKMHNGPMHNEKGSDSFNVVLNTEGDVVSVVTSRQDSTFDENEHTVSFATNEESSNVTTAGKETTMTTTHSERSAAISPNEATVATTKTEENMTIFAENNSVKSRNIKSKATRINQVDAEVQQSEIIELSGNKIRVHTGNVADTVESIRMKDTVQTTAPGVASKETTTDILQIKESRSVSDGTEEKVLEVIDTLQVTSENGVPKQVKETIRVVRKSSVTDDTNENALEQRLTDAEANDTDRGDGDLGEDGDDTDRGDEDSEDDDEEAREIDRMLADIKQYKEALSTEDAVLLKVLENGLRKEQRDDQQQQKEMIQYIATAILMMIIAWIALKFMNF